MPRRPPHSLKAPVAPIRWAESFIELIFPERCLFCRAVLPPGAGRALCSSCGRLFSPVGFICPACENLASGDSSCRCLTDLPFLKSLFALAFYEDQWRLLLHNLKYGGRRSLARPLGRWLGFEIMQGQPCRPDLVVPVPLHRRREKERGFNQSMLIADHAARVMGKPALPLLAKNRDTLSQTTLSRRERLENVSGAFSALPGSLEGASVLLIDDVYSTGSTLKEGARVLHARGAVVSGAVIAYNPSAVK